MSTHAGRQGAGLLASSTALQSSLANVTTLYVLAARVLPSRVAHVSEALVGTLGYSVCASDVGTRGVILGYSQVLTSQSP